MYRRERTIQILEIPLGWDFLVTQSNSRPGCYTIISVTASPIRLKSWTSSYYHRTRWTLRKVSKRSAGSWDSQIQPWNFANLVIFGQKKSCFYKNRDGQILILPRVIQPPEERLIIAFDLAEKNIYKGRNYKGGKGIEHMFDRLYRSEDLSCESELLIHPVLPQNEAFVPFRFVRINIFRVTIVTKGYPCKATKNVSEPW